MRKTKSEVLLHWKIFLLSLADFFIPFRLVIPTAIFSDGNWVVRFLALFNWQIMLSSTACFKIRTLFNFTQIINSRDLASIYSQT